MNWVKKIGILVVVAALFSIASDAIAQCPMCRTAVETAMQEGEKTGDGLNDGIIYLLSIPYVAVMVTGGIWYYHRKKSKNG